MGRFWCAAGYGKGRPYGGLQEVRCGEVSPSHGFAVPGRIATASVRTGFAMTHCKECVGRADVGIGPYEVFTDRIS